MRLVLAVSTAAIVSIASRLAVVHAAADQPCTNDELAALATIAAAQAGLLYNCETQSGYTLYPFTSYPTTAQQSVVCIGRSCPNAISNFQQAAALPECLVTVDGQQMTTVAFLDTVCDVRTPTPTPTSSSTAAPTSTPTPSSADSSSSSTTSSPPSTPQAGSGSSTSVPSPTPTSENEASGSTVEPSASASASTSSSTSGSSTANASTSGSEDLPIESLSSSSSTSTDMSTSSESGAESAAETPGSAEDGAGRSGPKLLFTALAVCTVAIAAM